MNRWVIQSLRVDGKWSTVSGSFDRRRGIPDGFKPLRPKSLEECIDILYFWYNDMVHGREKFTDNNGRSPADWTYRLYNPRTKESIPGDLFK